MKSETPPWFELAFGAHYPALYAHRDDQTAVEEVSKLAGAFDFVRPGTRTLDLCCGTGRHAVALDHLGLNLWGYDLSPQLLDRARQRSALAGRLTRGDMRHLPYRARFDLVVNLFTSFGYFPQDSENEAVLAEMVRVLRPGGHLLMDHINAARLRAHLVAEDSRRGPGIQIEQRRRIDGHRIQKDVVIKRTGASVMRYREDVRFYTPEEMTTLLESYGMEEISFCGGFDGAPLTAESMRMIVAARKRLT